MQLFLGTVASIEQPTMHADSAAWDRSMMLMPSVELMLRDTSLDPYEQALGVCSPVESIASITLS